MARRICALGLLLATTACRSLPSRPSTITSEERVAMAAVLDTLIKARGDSGKVCLAVVSHEDGSTIFDQGLAALMQAGARVVRPQECPHTYASMMGPVDAEGRRVERVPPGHFDPLRFEIGRPVFRNRGGAWVYVRLAHRTARLEYWCQVLFTGGVRVDRCHQVVSSVS